MSEETKQQSLNVFAAKEYIELGKASAHLDATHVEDAAQACHSELSTEHHTSESDDKTTVSSAFSCSSSIASKALHSLMLSPALSWQSSIASKALRSLILSGVAAV